jgi:hypothetical protein
MKLSSRLNNAIFNLRDIVYPHAESESIEPTEFVYLIRDWFRHFVLPLYPESPTKFPAIRFLFETPAFDLPVTQSSCLGFMESVNQFNYRDRNDFISAISDHLINDLVIHRHPEWLDLAQGDYEYYYCATTDEVVLSGEILGELTLSGQEWKGETVLIPATRTVLMRAGVPL